MPTPDADPQPALALLQRARGFLPGNPRLETAWVDLLGQAGRPEEQLAVVETLLAELPPGDVEGWLRAVRVVALVELGRLDEAEAETVRQGGVLRPDAWAMADSWARIALAREALGQPEAADRCFDSSLDLGPAGLATLAMETIRRPERAAAARSLRRRARARHRGHPDLELAHVEQLVSEADVAAAEAQLAGLSAPVPARLRSQVEGLRAHLARLAGRTDEAIALVGARLRRAPSDPVALSILWDLWSQHGEPSREVVTGHFQAALERARDPALRARLQAALSALASDGEPTPVAPIEDGP